MDSDSVLNNVIREGITEEMLVTTLGLLNILFRFSVFTCFSLYEHTLCIVSTGYFKIFK